VGVLKTYYETLSSVRTGFISRYFQLISKNRENEKTNIQYWHLKRLALGICISIVSVCMYSE